MKTMVVGDTEEIGEDLLMWFTGFCWTIGYSVTMISEPNLFFTVFYH